MSGGDPSIGQSLDASTPEDAEVARLLDEYLADLEAGRPADPGRLMAEHPAIASQLRVCLEVMHLAGRVAGSGAAAADGEDDAGAGPRLADYRIVRQIGRGGMGIVYEAEQQSLRRRVALKVLPLASALDPRQLRRFHVEAQAAAQLHHTHIVPVYAVGCERGVHYYAMQYIEGKSLAELIRELRQLEGRDAAEEAPTVVLGGDHTLASLLASGQLAPPEKAMEPGPAAAPMPDRPPARSAGPAPSSSSLTSGYFRTVANLGVQAAEALEHAHQEGIVHRDIKPANLMVDVEGHLWITDFGLARLQNDSGLTLSGDLVGTIRYMSPEQAIGHRALVDRRTDIYALGVTLYELVALEPAFDGADRREVLRRIIEEEPRPLRARNPAVPRELGTIIQKAIAKEPESRYPTAQDLADDLRRFLEHRPIQAKRSSLLDRAAKWSRRHRTVVASAFLILLLTVGGLSVALVLIGRERDLAAAKEREASASAREARERAIELERQLYINRVNRALGEWREDNVALADRLLQDCPRGLRGWEWDYCRRLCHLERATLPGDGWPIHGLAFHPDGRSIVTAATSFFEESRRTGGWTLWDVATGRVLRRCPAPGAQFIAVDPSGTILAVGMGHGPLALWKIGAEEPSSGAREPLRIVRDPVDPAVIALRPDGRELAVVVVSEGHTLLETWEVSTGRRRHRIELAVEVGMRAVTYSPDGKQLTGACTDGTVRNWDAATGACGPVLRGHAGMVYDAAYSPDGRSLASGGQDQTVRVWDRASGSSKVLRGHRSIVRAVAFHPDGTRIASASQDSTVRVWDVATGREIGVLRGHTAPVADVAFSPDGRRIASASHDGTVKIWDPAAVEPAIALAHPNLVPRAAFTPDGSAIVSACWDNVIRIWDVATGREVRAIHREPRAPTVYGVGPEIVHSLAIRPDGRRIASTNRSGTVLIWDAPTGRLVRTLRGHQDRTLGVAFHPDGRRIASASWDGTVRIWDGETGEPIRLFRGPRGIAITANYSPDGTRIASAFTDGTIRIWNPADGKAMMQLACESHPDQSPVLVNMVAFRPDGQWLAACSNPPSGRGSGEVRVFDLATGRRVFTLLGHTGEVWGVTFTPDGRRIVTSGQDRTVKFWETETGQEVFTLRGHTNGVIGVAFSADGRGMVTGSNDNTAKIWDTMAVSEEPAREEPPGDQLQQAASMREQPPNGLPKN